MLKKIYKLPLTGKVKTKFPVDGFRESPLEPINIIEYYYQKIEPFLPQYFTDKELEFSYGVLNYDVDNNFAEVIIEAEQHLFDWLDLQLGDKTKDELYSLTKQSKLDLSKAKERPEKPKKYLKGRNND